MIKMLSISQLRRELPQVLKELQTHPEVVYQISVNRVVVGELVAPRKLEKKGKAARKLMALSDKFEKIYKGRTKAAKVSEKHDKFIYR